MEEKSMSRSLPVFNIAGTEFYVDMRLNEFRQKNDPYNRISMDEIREDTSGNLITGFLYDLKTRNVFTGEASPDNLPPNVKLVIVPPLTELDPVGLARRYGLPDDTFITKDTTEKQEGKTITPKDKNKGADESQGLGF